MAATEAVERYRKAGERAMEGGARLAIAILVLFLAMVAFFFAFHPHGVANPDGSPVNNPGDILKWMFGAFETTSNPGSTPIG